MAWSSKPRTTAANPSASPGPYNLLGVAVAAHYLCRHRVAPETAWPAPTPTPPPPRHSVGWDPLPDQVYINTNYAPLPCGGQAGTFGVTGPCWTHEQPVVEIRASGA